jgi:malonate transporter
MSPFVHYFLLSSPLFGLVLLGYVIASRQWWRVEWTKRASWAVFSVALPAMLFQMMSSHESLPPVDERLLIAFFGGCLIVFVIGRLVARWVFQLDGVSQSVFALGGIFSNNVMLGLPLAKLTLGPAALPAVALVLVFNALTLWTLASISVEWARQGAFSVAGFANTAVRVLTNPIVAAIVLGTIAGLLNWHMPAPIDAAFAGVGAGAAPGALLVLGMGLSAYPVKHEWRQGVAICILKLLVQPLTVWFLGGWLGVPPLELTVIVLLASLAVGANVYLMSVQFDRMQGTIATSLVASTVLASITTPLWLSWLRS